jgi:hypothetical protein
VPIESQRLEKREGQVEVDAGANDNDEATPPGQYQSELQHQCCKKITTLRVA